MAIEPVLAAAYRTKPPEKTGFEIDALGAGDALGCTVRFQWSTLTIKFPIAAAWAWQVTPARPQLNAAKSLPFYTSEEVEKPAFVREVAEAIATARPQAKHSQGKIVFYSHRGR